MKKIETLIKDIREVLNTGNGWTKEISEWVAEDSAKSLERQMRGINRKRKGTT